MRSPAQSTPTLLAAQVEYLVLDTNAELAEPAVESYLRRLQGERDSEAAALANAAKDAKQGSGGEDEWALDPTLLRRMAAVRDAERGLIVQVGGRLGSGVRGESHARGWQRWQGVVLVGILDSCTPWPNHTHRSCCTC